MKFSQITFFLVFSAIVTISNSLDGKQAPDFIQKEHHLSGLPFSSSSTDADSNENYASLTFIVENGARQCFHYTAGGDFEVEYEVLKGSSYDVGLVIEDSEGALIHKNSPTAHNEVQVSVPESMLRKDYRICFDNRKASYGSKHVFMQVALTAEARRNVMNKLRTLGSNSADELKNLQITMESFSRSMERLDSAMQQIMHQQTRFRLTEYVDRNVMEENFERVNLWSGFQLAVMVLMALLQVYMIRSLFRDPRREGAMQKVWNMADCIFSRWLNNASSSSAPAPFHNRPRC